MDSPHQSTVAIDLFISLYLILYVYIYIYTSVYLHLTFYLSTYLPSNLFSSGPILSILSFSFLSYAILSYPGLSYLSICLDTVLSVLSPYLSYLLYLPYRSYLSCLSFLSTSLSIYLSVWCLFVFLFIVYDLYLPTVWYFYSSHRTHLSLLILYNLISSFLFT